MKLRQWQASGPQWTSAAADHHRASEATAAQCSEARSIADRAIADGITPLEVQLKTMRYLWEKAHEPPELDMQLAREACAVASQCAPYIHPRLASVDAKIEIDSSTQLNDAERRERARQMIVEAFAERPALNAPVIVRCLG